VGRCGPRLATRLLAAGLAAALAAPALDAWAEDKQKKPSLNLRSTPRFAFSPARVLFVAELQGGDDVEEYYCPEVEWDWDDGGKSVTGADCPPFVAGQTKIERRFSTEHEFKRAGNYSVKVSLKRLGKSFATQNLRMTVRAGAGDRTFEEP
jgi:plastocyanin